MNNKVLSIIIPTYNSERYIEKCLRAIHEQEYKDYEVIIVDQESTDQTVTIAKKYYAQVISVPKPKFYSPPSASRNVGAGIAKGEVLYHLDSDMQVSKKLFSEIMKIFSTHKDVGALIVHEKDITKGFFSKCKALERMCYQGNDSIDSARVVRKSVFNQISGYDEAISSGEDFDIHERYKAVTKVMYCKNRVSHDLTQLNFMNMIKKKFNYGKTAGAYFKKSDRTGGGIVKQQIESYVKNYRLLLQHPVLAIGMIFMRTCEIFAGGLGFLLSKKSI